MILRPYQAAALDEIRSLYAQGTKKVLLQLATGGGKTLIFCEVLKGVHARNKKAIMVVRGAQLVEQASKRLDREGVPHGVIQASHWRRMPGLPIQICSIDTLVRRRTVPPADLIVIDEAHLASSPSFRWLVSHYPDAFFLPVTATPYNIKGGLRHIADEVVYPISTKGLIDQGYLVAPRYFMPSQVDLTGVDIDKKTQDYVQGQLAERMDQPTLFGSMTTAYKKYAAGRPALCFAVSIRHSLHIVDSFNSAGLRAAHMEADTPPAEREKLIKDLEEGRLDVISNVGILTTGVDIPPVSCIILARPTKSYNLYLQILGRGTRLSEGKSDFIVLDHANAIKEHGFITDERTVDLDGKPIKPRGLQVLICEQCFSAFNPREHGSRICPECGFENATKKDEEKIRSTKTDETRELVEITSSEEMEQIKISHFIDSKIRTAMARGYRVGWVYHQIKNAYGEGVAKRHWKYIKEKFGPDQTRYASFSSYSGAS